MDIRGQEEFYFVVKEIDTNFNLMPDDQATEHMNSKSKVGGGLVGIIQSEHAHTKWCLTRSDKAQLAEDTIALLGAGHACDVNEEEDDDDPHNDMLRSRMKKDQDHADTFCKQCRRFQVHSSQLVSLVAGDVATHSIGESLLGAVEKGKAVRRCCYTQYW